MIPIFEQKDGKGYGHGMQSFVERFDEICAEHLKAKRAASFAFVFRDFKDFAMTQIMRDQGVFAQLDRLSGTKLSLFFLHTSSRVGTQAFNEYFMSRLGIADATLPCVAFFDFRKGEIENVRVACLDQNNLIHGFHELYRAIELRIRERKVEPLSGKALRWIKGGSKIIVTEAFKGAFREGVTILVRMNH